MKKTIIFTLTAFAALFTIIFSSCASKPQEQNIPQEQEIIEDELPPDEIPEEIQPEVTEIDEEVILIEEEGDSSDDEYLRSIANLNETESVSKQEFTDDKNEILDIISDLAVIMETKDTLGWLDYICEESKTYYKNPANLRKAQKRHKNPLIEFRTIEDYFLNVFIEARKYSSIDEIRYVSRTKVKAVQVREDTDVVYYEFIKENDKWKVYLPPVS